MALSQLYDAQTGDTITAARWDNEFGNIYNNGTDVAFPLTKAVSFAGYTITWDSAGVTTMISSASQAWQMTPGAKSGTPSTTGGVLNIVASTYTDNNTAGSGTATAFAAYAFQRPTLAATNASVTTTNAAVIYVVNDVAAGTNETLTNTYAIWVDAGNCRFDGQIHGAGMPIVQELRLTLTTAVPVTTADVTAAETIYLTPYVGSHISLYDGTIWKTFSTAEISVDVPDATNAYDMFGYISSGAPALETLAWTDESNRATALAYQNGVLIKSGDATRRYLGSFYCTTAGNGQTEDSAANRYLCNYYHRIRKGFSRVDATNSWTFTGATPVRQANASTANQCNIMVGVAESWVEATVVSTVENDTGSVTVGVAIGINSTTTNSAQVFGTVTPSTARIGHTASYRGIPAAGRNQIVWLEQTSNSGTDTYQGDNNTTRAQTGLVGSCYV